LNEKDIQLARAIESEIPFESESFIVLLTTKYTNLVRVNLVVLKAFLDDKRKRGVIITIDRPYQYISHLLQLHGIDQANLTYVDVISSHASDSKGGAVTGRFQHSPFHIESLPDLLFSEESSEGPNSIDISCVEFVVIDNISTALTYNTMDSLKGCFSRYTELTRRHKSGPIITILVMDRELHSELFKVISEVSKITIDIGPDLTVRRFSGRDAPVPKAAPALSSAPLSLNPDIGIVRSKGVM